MSFMLFVRFLWLSLMFFCALSEADPAHYFVAEIPVKSQSTPERNLAAKQGLIDVLVRVSGTEQVKSDIYVQRQLNKAAAMISDFQYANLDNDVFYEQGFRHTLKLRFAQNEVRKVLREAGLPTWSVNNRPKVLVWLVEDSALHGKTMLGEDGSNPIILGLKKAAAYRGLPLAFPLLDFEDQVSLGAETLWNLDNRTILEASERYQAQTVLVGKYTSLSSGMVISTWQFLSAENKQLYDIRSEDLAQIGFDAIHPLADNLASTYSFNTLGSQAFSLVVENIGDFKRYRALMSLLTSFDAVTNITIERIVGEIVYLKVASDADATQLISQISLTRALHKVNNLDTSGLPVWQQRVALGTERLPLRYMWTE